LRVWIIILFGAACSAALRAAEPECARKPVVSKGRDGQVVIEFVLKSPTDVAVFIENAKGEAVQHLAAGADRGGLRSAVGPRERGQMP
jgi:hypothetical protein